MSGQINRAPSKGIRKDIGALLDTDFSSSLISFLRATGYEYRNGNTHIKLAAEFGFCYGVDRAVEYAFAARHRYPDRSIWLTGEIIHNPRVNSRLREMGIQFLPETGTREERFRSLSKGDVILIPAFGADAGEMTYFLNQGYEIIDTTCGSVLNVWKRVRHYAKENFTSIVHGKFDHEETRATCSQVTAANPESHFLVVLDMDQALELAQFIESDDFSRFGEIFPQGAMSDGLDPVRHLTRVGLANQTTMLESESRAIQDVIRRAMEKRFGMDNIAEHIMAFDTICSATEDRQRAVKALLTEGVDMMIVIGGYNSSNTGHLLEIADQAVPAYHIESTDCLLDAKRILAKPLGEEPIEMVDWLPEDKITIGVTGGASTPDSVVGRVIARLFELRGADLPTQKEIDAAT